MQKNKTKNNCGTENNASISTSSAATTTTSNLPGLDNVQVIISHPLLIKENSSKVSEAK
jgi:hypothetical protein